MLGDVRNLVHLVCFYKDVIVFFFLVNLVRNCFFNIGPFIEEENCSNPRIEEREPSLLPQMIKFIRRA